MKSAVCFAASVLAVLTGPVPARASGPVSVYALIEKLTFEPSADKPERIRITGVFMAATGTSFDYSPPQKGYLYLALPSNNRQVAIMEWTDLKSIAGSRQVVGIGSSWSGNVRVRKPDETPTSPDEYPLGNGLTKLNADHPRAKALLEYRDR